MMIAAHPPGPGFPAQAPSVYTITSGCWLDVIRKLAMALSVSADMLLFEKDERGPDEELKFQFEAVSRLDPEEKKVIRSVIESIILRHEARRWSSPGSEAK